MLRGTSPNPTVALTPDLGVVTSFVDTGLQNGTTYYYKVSALNGNGAGPTSNQASATPAALVAPDTPLAVLDSFNRANENPLTDAGRWSNAIIGGEGGFTVNANQLACGVATTCTAWRNNTQYGPDAEVYARLTTLPGVNNVIRLNVRLQNPGAAPITGYLIRANQLSGTDEIWLERFDNGSAIRLQTIPQELVAGDTLLLRAKGTSIEVWRQPSGGSWSRLGVVQDATYGGAGYVGVGLRGTTGRLDDFGGRTLGLAPPSAPSAPQGLGATPANNQVTLNWSAPSSNGGSALTTYTVYRSLTSGGATTTLTSAPYLSTSLVDSTAVNGTTYYYKVTASNAVGESLPSNEVSAQPVAPASAPSAPQGLGATPANNQVTLNWSAPSSNGGSALTTYTVYRSLTSGGATTTLTSAPYLSTSLVDSTAVNGTTYYYKVTASNAVGESLPSNEVSAQPVAPASAPSAPQGLGATPANNQVTLNWSAPSSNGGSALTTYTRLSLAHLGRRDHHPHERSLPVDEPRGLDRRERHDLLLQGHRLQRGRRVAALERGLSAAGRTRERPLGSPGPGCDARQQPGHPELERSQLERRLCAHDLHRLSLAHLGRRDHHPHERSLPVDEPRGLDRRERHDLLLQGHRLQRGRRVAALERGLSAAGRTRERPLGSPGPGCDARPTTRSP